VSASGKMGLDAYPKERESAKVDNTLGALVLKSLTSIFAFILVTDKLRLMCGWVRRQEINHV